MRSCHLRLALGNLILVCVSVTQLRWLLVRRKLPLIRWLYYIEKHIKETERRAQVRPTCLMCEQFEQWTEPQLKGEPEFVVVL